MNRSAGAPSAGPPNRSNHSTLAENTLLGLSPSGGVVYLELLDRLAAHACREKARRAFFLACRFEREVGATLGQIFDRYPPFAAMDSAVREGLDRFLAKRWLNNFAGLQ